MLAGIVVDTSVLVHAHNPEHAFARESRALALRLLDDDVATALCVDPGFHPSPERNHSRIAREYHDNLVPGMLGHQVLQVLAASQRVRPVQPAADQNIRRRVRRLVVEQHKDDRVFLLVAIATDEKILVSHDDGAFPDDVRNESMTRWSVTICEAIDVVPRL